MRLPKLAIDNYQFTVVILLLLVISGIVSFFTMPRSEDPPVAKPGASVVVIYPGANPADLEQLIVDPLEEAINELDDVKRINSHCEDGIASVHTEFLVGTDPDEKYSDVVQKVNSIRSQLPQDILYINLFKWQVSDVCMLQLALISETVSYSELEKEAERLKKSLEKVSGVRKVDTWALPKQEVHVNVDLETMAQKRIALKQIFGAIQSANVNIPGGNLDIGSKRFSIQTSGSYQSLDDIRQTIVNSDGANIVYLRDIADVNFNYEDITYHARLNGKRSIFVTVNQKERTNIFDIMKNLDAKISDFKSKLPESIQLYHIFNQSESVANRMDRFFSNLLQGMVLVGLVIFLSLSFRAAWIVMVAIPISILIGIGFVDISGYGLEQMSIAGLVVVLGILVDNAIVVTENASRFIKQGYNHTDAAIEGTKQVGWAIVSATATTILAFVPMIMMQDVTGDFIRSMPITVVYTLTASLLVALTITPYSCSKFLKIEKVIKENRVQRLFNYIITSPYRKTLHFSLSHHRLVLVITIAVFLFSLALFPLVGVSFFPKAEKPQFVINIDTPKGTNLDKTDAVARYVELVLASRNEIKHYATNIGHGNPRIYYNIMSKSERSTHAQFFVQLKNNDLKIYQELIADLRQIFSRYPAAKIEIKELEQGPPVEAPIAIKVLGENLDELSKLSRQVEQIIVSTPGTVNVDNPLRTTKTDLHVKINRDKAGMYGVLLVDIDRTVRTCFAGMNISQYRDARGKEYDIIVRPANQGKLSINDFDKIYVTSATGAQIPLKQLAAIEFKSTPIQIDHFNLEREVTITADVLSGYSVDKVTKKIIAQLEKMNFPEDYRFFVGGELESREESFGGMTRAIIIAMLGIFGVLVLQFRSFRQPLIVFSAIPLAIIGSIVALLLTGNSFSFTAFVGLTSLVGIVVNNSIILVDYTNKLKDDGLDLISALKQAGETRFRPIILTTGTTIGGLLPLTLQGGTLWAPMGWTIIGGLTMSTFLTLVVVPVLYKIFTSDSK